MGFKGLKLLKLIPNKKKVIIIALLLLLMTGVLVTMVSSVAKKENFTEDSFYSERRLKDLDLKFLEPIEFEKSVCVDEEFFCAQIADKAVYEEYVDYVFNFLKTSPYVSRLGIINASPEELSDEVNTYYFIPAYNKSDFMLDHRMDCYDFYFIIDFPDDHEREETITLRHIHLSYGEDIELAYGDDQKRFVGNFRMRLETCDNDEMDYYLIEEFYNYSKVEINDSNVNDYFEVKMDGVNSFFGKIVSKSYLFFANIHMKMEVTISNGDGQTMTKELYRDFFLETRIQFANFSVSPDLFDMDSLDGWNLEEIKMNIDDASVVYHVNK